MPDFFKSLVSQLQQNNEERLQAICEGFSRSVRVLCEHNGNFEDMPKVEVSLNTHIYLVVARIQFHDIQRLRKRLSPFERIRILKPY